MKSLRHVNLYPITERGHNQQKSSYPARDHAAIY